MANEIALLDFRGSPTDAVSLGVVFLYPTPEVVVVTPSTDLSTTAAKVITQAEKDALDTGLLAFEEGEFPYDLDATPAENAVRLRTAYANKLANFNTNYSRRMQYFGDRLDAS
jgi:hypothetical protein